ncbi:MAG: protein phosphatase 2C domain-containing protein [Gemmatimonadota bacterium]|nr:protein phosphatase 2C domain-containing protein [Gemmatimonadota bacterium]
MAPREATADGVAVQAPRPTDDELDMFGITHRGKVRPENQDHFLVCTVHPQVVIHGTSLPDPAGLPLRGTRLSTMLLVADGVGGAASGSDAARLATEAITRYVSSTLRCYHSAGASSDDEFLTALRAAALEAHEAVRAEAARRTGQKKMATTLTVGIAVWPWMYIVQVGDSRAYLSVNGELRQLTRDQTIGQDLVDKGVLPRERLERSPFRNVLSSAIGAEEALPEVTRLNISERESLVMLCSDGLTKHVTDEEIAAALADVKSSEQAASELLDLALSRGGSDNITIVVAHAPLRQVDA